MFVMTTVYQSGGRVMDRRVAGDPGFRCSERRCDQWDASLRTLSDDACDAGSGEPWVSRDGYTNPAGKEDSDALIITIDTIEKLTLAWWSRKRTGSARRAGVGCWSSSIS